jgi:hypothetical protein
MNQHGGVIGFNKKLTALKDFSKHCFAEFVRNCTVEYLNKGTYGVIMKLTIMDPSKSPYVDLNKKPVTVLIVKIGTVSSKKRQVSVLKNTNPLESVTLTDFKKEHFVQEMVFRKSLEKFNSAICPAVVHVDILGWDQMKQYTPLVPFFNTDLQNIKFSLIAMETFGNVNTLFHMNSTSYRSLTHYLLLRLGALGYAHGDPSLANILIDEKMKRPYLIDFGKVQVLSEKEIEFMKDELVRPTNYPEVSKIILKGYPLTHPSFPNWDWVKNATEFPKVEKAQLLKIVDRNWSQLL